MENILDAGNWEENEKQFAEEFDRWETAFVNRGTSERDWLNDNPKPINRNEAKFFNGK